MVLWDVIECDQNTLRDTQEYEKSEKGDISVDVKQKLKISTILQEYQIVKKVILR